MLERRGDPIVACQVPRTVELSWRPSAFQPDFPSEFEYLRTPTKKIADSRVDVRLVAWAVTGMLVSSHGCQHQTALVRPQQRHENLSIEPRVAQVTLKIV
jgi:hypothetical protein